MRCKDCDKKVGFFYWLLWNRCKVCGEKYAKEYRKELDKKYLYDKKIKTLVNMGWGFRKSNNQITYCDGYGYFEVSEKDLRENDLVQIKDKYQKDARIKREIHKIELRNNRRKIKEEAEKRVYGKVKTKRQPISSNDRESIFAKFNNECAICGEKEGLHIHHKDKNPKNNRISNLIVLCGVCHKKIHMTVR